MGELEKKYLKIAFKDSIFPQLAIAFFAILPMMIAITIYFGDPGQYESFKTNAVNNLTLASNSVFNSLHNIIIQNVSKSTGLIPNQPNIIPLNVMIWFWMLLPLLAIAVMIIYLICDYFSYRRDKKEEKEKLHE